MADGTVLVAPRPLLPQLLRRASSEGQERPCFVGAFDSPYAIPPSALNLTVYCWLDTRGGEPTLGFNLPRLRKWVREEAVALSIPADAVAVDAAVEHFQRFTKVAFDSARVMLARRMPDATEQVRLACGFPAKRAF